MIEAIRQYFINNNIIDEENRINVDFLGPNATEFALESISVNPILERYDDGSSFRQFQFQLISRNDYGADVMQNISNSTFYDDLYDLIETNNETGNLPEIECIDSIECLNNGSILSADTNSAKYSIIMRITYYKD